MEQQAFQSRNIRAPSPLPSSLYDIPGLERYYNGPERHYNGPGRHYITPERHYNAADREHNGLVKHFNATGRHYSVPERHYNGSERYYNETNPHYNGTERLYDVPERQNNRTDPHYDGPESHYNGSDQHYINGEVESFLPTPHDERSSSEAVLDNSKSQSHHNEHFSSHDEEEDSSSPSLGLAYNDALAGLEMAHEKSSTKLTSRLTNVSPLLPDKDLVVQAIEAASAVLRDQASALRDQISENEVLKSALRLSEWELQNYKIEQELKGRQPEKLPQDEIQLKPSTPERSGLMQGSNPRSRDQPTGNDYGDSLSSLIVHPDSQSISGGHYWYPSNSVKGQQYGPNIGINGPLKFREQQNGGILETARYMYNLSNEVPYIGIDGLLKSREQHNGGILQASLETARSNREGESDARIPSSAQGNMQNWQELVPSALNPQEEIKQLRKQLTDATSKEMQLVHENHSLQTLVHELRLTIEKYQQDLVERRGTAELLKENAILKSESRIASQNNHFYTSSLMSLLVDYNLQPMTEDPHSIVSGIKALIQHLREEAMKGSEPSKQPWLNFHANQPAQQVSSPSAFHGRSRTPRSPEPQGLEIVSQGYMQSERPYSPSSPFSHNTTKDWEISNAAHNYPNEISSRETEINNNNGYQPGYEPRSPYDEDSNQISGEQVYDRDPRLPTLHEEASDNEEDPLPDIEGLCINGEAVLGNTISACGVSVNGTTLCHFQWVRHNRDGSFFHISGAAQPEYTITADDIDTLLSLECTPMDDRNRKGEMVQVFVNDRNWISLETDITNQIMGFLDTGLAIFEVKLGVGSSQEDTFDPALLTMKRSNYELKKLNGRRVANDRYASESPVEIKVGNGSQCAIIGNGGIMYLLDCMNNRTRDLLVLTMREFIKAAVDRKRGKKGFWTK